MIQREEEPMLGKGFVKIHPIDTWLYHHIQVVRMKLHDAIHACRVNDDASVGRRKVAFD
jgi:hypothetical protein